MTNKDNLLLHLEEMRTDFASSVDMIDKLIYFIETTENPNIESLNEIIDNDCFKVDELDEFQGNIYSLEYQGVDKIIFGLKD